MKTKEIWSEDGALLAAEFRRSVQLLKVYPLDTINSIVSFVIISTIFMVGIRAVGDSSQIFGVVFFPVMLNLISGPSASIRNDIEMGVFEQVYISKYSLLKVAVIRTIVSGIVALFGSAIIALILHLFFIRITFSPLHMIFLFLLFGTQSLLLGVALAGVTLRYRKTETLLNSLNLFVMILLILPLLSISRNSFYVLSAFCPLWGVVTYYQQLVTGMQGGQIFLNITCSLVNTICLAFLAFGVYEKLLRETKRRGYLGQY